MPLHNCTTAPLCRHPLGTRTLGTDWLLWSLRRLLNEGLQVETNKTTTSTQTRPNLGAQL